VATDDKGGRHTIHLYLDVLDDGSFEDLDAEAEPNVTLVTEDGTKLTHLAKGEYQTLLGERLHSDDPAAP
jgi:hypothetical protein